MTADIYSRIAPARKARWAAALLVAAATISTTAVAGTTTITTERHCYFKRSRISGNSSNCHTDVEIRLPPRPRPIIIEPPRPVLPPSAQRDERTGVVIMRGMPDR